KITNEKEVTEQGDDFGTIPHKAGTGPYYVTEYNVASGVKMDAYEDYWRGAPAIKHVEFKVIADEAAAVIAYENGDIDYLAEVNLSDWDAVSSKEGGQSTMLKGNDITWLGINYLSHTANDALMNEKVRQAIFYAIDKDAINTAVFDGKGTVTNEYMPHDYVPTQPSEGFMTYEYDPDKAKALLEEAGYGDGLDLGNILTYGGADSPKGKAAVVIQDNLAQVGITVGVDMREYAAAEADMYGQNYDIVIFGDSNNYDFNNIRQQVHSESTGMYLVKFKDDRSPFNWQRMEELIDLGVSTTDIDERLTYYTELWDMVMKTATIDPLVHKPVGIVWSGDLDIGEPVPNFYKIRTFSWK
ncbi:MAG: ABC transporter substrate-binding protein, partial [Anaerovoracaceae bacterium]